MVKNADKRGRGVQNPENLADVICERPLMSAALYARAAEQPVAVANNLRINRAAVGLFICSIWDLIFEVAVD